MVVIVNNTKYDIVLKSGTNIATIDTTIKKNNNPLMPVLLINLSITGSNSILSNNYVGKLFFKNANDALLSFSIIASTT